MHSTVQHTVTSSWQRSRSFRNNLNSCYKRKQLIRAGATLTYTRGKCNNNNDNNNNNDDDVKMLRIHP